MGAQKQTTLLVTSVTQSVITTVNRDKTGVRRYSPFGFLQTDDSMDARCAFNGCYHEPATDIYLLGNGYRAFNPVLMRFHSPDSFSPFAEGGLNAYAYVGNDPANRIDPSGHFSINPVKLFRRLTRGSKQRSELIETAAGNITLKTSTYKIKKLGVLGHEAYWFNDYYKGEKTLNIYAHGGNGRIDLAKNYQLEAAEFKRHLELNNVLPGNYERIHLMGFRVGAGSGHPFAQELSDLTGLKIKSYENQIFTEFSFKQIASITRGLQNMQTPIKIPINTELMILKYKHIRHAQRVAPGTRPDVYSPRHVR